MKFPEDHKNPVPSGRYNLVVIGGGIAGLSAALSAAELGAKVAVIERSRLGGRQLPVMTARDILLREAHKLAASQGFGPTVEFQKIRDAIKLSQVMLDEFYAPDKYQQAGIELYHGVGKFNNSSQIEVSGQIITFSRAVIATGSCEKKFDDIDQAQLLSLDKLTELPKSLAVIGSEPIALEIAQAFAIFGTEVTWFGKPQLDTEAEKILLTMLQGQGVKFGTGQANYKNFEKIFLAEPRKANVDGLNLASAAIELSDAVVKVTDGLRTSNPKVFAAGDVCSGLRTFQAADAMGKVIVANSLFFGRHRVSSLILPHCIYTSPQIAWVGIDPEKAGPIQCKTVTAAFSKSGDPSMDTSSEGFLKIHYDHRGHISGAIAVSTQASEIIGEVVLAMQHKIKIWNLGSVLHPYPAQNNLIKRAGDSAKRTLLTPAVASLLKKIMEWRR